MDDQILSVNGNSMENVSHAQAVQALKDAGSTVVLIVRHGVGLAVSRSVSPPHRNTPPRSPEPPFITVVLEKAPGRGEQEWWDWVKGEGLCTYVRRWWWGVWGGDIGCNQGVWLCCTDILVIRISFSESSILTCILHVRSGHPSPCCGKSAKIGKSGPSDHVFLVVVPLLVNILVFATKGVCSCLLRNTDKFDQQYCQPFSRNSNLH